MNLFHLHSTTPISKLAKKLEILIINKLWLQVLFGMAAGLSCGILLGPDTQLVQPQSAAMITEWLALPGYVFLRVIKMVLIPLVVASIIRGLGGSSDANGLKSLGLKFAVYVMCTSTIATTIGITLTRLIKPGLYVTLPNTVPVVTRNAVAIPSLADLPSTIVQIIPINPLASASQGELLGVVIFSIIVGVALALQKNKTIEPLLRVTDGVLEVAMTIVRWAMLLAPFAVFGLTAQMAAQTGIVTIIGLSVYVATVLLGLSLLLVLYITLLFVIKGLRPFTFLKAILPAQLVAFSTSSSAAVLPLSFKVAQENLHVEPHVTEIILPLGATMNMDGTALYQSVAILFLAQISGIDFTLIEYILLVATLVLSSVGAPSTPGVSMAIVTATALNFGIPTAGIALVMGVDRLLDMARTTINVTGDLTACVLFSPKKASRWSK